MRNGTQAANQMKRWSKTGKTNVKGLCLKTCREAYLLPARYPSAIVSWNRTPKKYKNKNFRSAPVGALHYYRGGKYGHIVIQSDLRNRVWGTDLPVVNKVGLHHRRLPINRWGYKYLGWTNWLNGYEVELGKCPK
jgi:hypothetical protein